MRGSVAWRQIQEERQVTQVVRERPREMVTSTGTVTYFPESVPDPLLGLLQTAGVPVERLLRGRVAQVISDLPVNEWSLELAVSISEEEGQAILGTLWSDIRCDSDEE
jgi:hypothetical protein